MPDAGVDVSVLVPVLNEEKHLPRAVEAMLGQDFGGTVEFLFIEGGSEDASPMILSDLAQRDSRVRILANPHRHTPHGLNIGLHAARGEFIARMDAHTLYPAAYLRAGVERLRHGDVASVSGPQLAMGVDRGSRRVALALSTALGTGGARFRRELAEEVEVHTGFTGLWRRTTLLEHGGWDEKWINDQDVELAARLRKRGGRIVCIPEMAAQYIPRGTLPALARQYWIYGKYRVKTARRHPESLQRSQLLPPALALAGIASASAPQPLRRMARAGVSSHLALLSATSARATARGGGADAAVLPGIWATMHLCYGLGFLVGCVRYGPPIAAMARLAGINAGRDELPTES